MFDNFSQKFVSQKVGAPLKLSSPLTIDYELNRYEAGYLRRNKA